MGWRWFLLLSIWELVGTEGDRSWGTMQVLGLVASLGAEAFLGARVVQATYRKNWSTKFPDSHFICSRETSVLCLCLGTENEQSQE